ncbi:hypothetical protein CFAM422_007914 [Trichoderma lentiforme]|uniref:Uncharacterized protein n=1 Tax=Trichoderma lentiforme TaxID=1567552 RepID=A0A9P5CD42_9HYPO|nr:hypothetical protein CFAM422_007914 [Trichoderma lentiforme]
MFNFIFKSGEVRQPSASSTASRAVGFSPLSKFCSWPSGFPILSPAVAVFHPIAQLGDLVEDQRDVPFQGIGQRKMKIELYSRRCKP